MTQYFKKRNSFVKNRWFYKKNCAYNFSTIFEIQDSFV